MEYKTSKEKQFDRIYQTYMHDVYKVGLYYTKDEYAAQELMQKAFFNFYQHMDNVNPARVRAYLIRSVRNLAYNLTRDTKYEELRGDSVSMEEQAELMISVEEAYLREEQKRRKIELSQFILQRLREENEDWYEALNLVYCLEKSQDQVAEELGVTKEVLYSRLYRAKRWIRKNYEKEYADIVNS